MKGHSETVEKQNVLALLKSSEIKCLIAGLLCRFLNYCNPRGIQCMPMKKNKTLASCSRTCFSGGFKIYVFTENLHFNFYLCEFSSTFRYKNNCLCVSQSPRDESLRPTKDRRAGSQRHHKVKGLSQLQHKTKQN